MVLEAIYQRRSIRRYQPKPIAQSQLKIILDAACWAPSAHNRQPWRFVVIQQAAHKINLAQAMGTRLRDDLTADAVPTTIIERECQRAYDRLTAAPALIIVCLTMSAMDTYRDARRNQNEYTMAVQSTAMAGQNILLAAHSLGLATCWMCAPLFCPDTVRTCLDLPADWQAQGLITIGYPDQQRTKTRQSSETRTLWR